MVVDRDLDRATRGHTVAVRSRAASPLASNAFCTAREMRCQMSITSEVALKPGMAAAVRRRPPRQMEERADSGHARARSAARQAGTRSGGLRPVPNAIRRRTGGRPAAYSTWSPAAATTARHCGISVRSRSASGSGPVSSSSAPVAARRR